jgi:hypothetical protein
MPLLSYLARVFLMRRLFDRLNGRSTARHSRRYPGRHRAHRRREGFGFFGPVPTYSRRTRGGGRVSVGGCCLPIPLGLVALVLATARLAVRRR